MNILSALLLLFRSLWKFIVHKVTGLTEVERASRRGDVLALQRSVSMSKVLAGFRANHFQWTQPYRQDLSKQLCAIKGITNSDSCLRVSTVLSALCSWRFAIHKIQILRKTSYHSSSQQHQQMLMDIWNALRPGRPIKGRKSEQWIEIGFQVEDPATDFRGAGYLGLANLHGWVAKEEGRRAFQIADTKETEYFFASASLFLTMLSVELLKGGQILSYYWVPREGEEVEGMFQSMFEAVWSEFAAHWLAASDKSMMQFNSTLLGFSRKLKEERLGQLNQRLMSLKKG